MRTQEAEEIADILFSQIFSRYGACRTLVTDRHYSNLSKIINILCKMFNITQHFTSSYHPQSNVACERMNSLIAQSLRSYCTQQQSNWPDILPRIYWVFSILHVIWKRNAITDWYISHTWGVDHSGSRKIHWSVNKQGQNHSWNSQNKFRKISRKKQTIIW